MISRIGSRLWDVSVQLSRRANNTVKWLSLLSLLLLPSLLLAYDYGKPIEIVTEEDLYELYAAGDITIDEFERLLALYRNKLDLNRARSDELLGLPDVSLELARAIEKQSENERFNDYDDVLRKVPGMTPLILEQMRPFTEIRLSLIGSNAFVGTVDVRSSVDSYRLEDAADLSDAETIEPGKSYLPAELGLKTLPESYVRVRGIASDRVKVGAIASEREGISRFVLDPDTQIFQATWGHPVLQLEKAYAEVDEGSWSAIVGHYTIGFGQKLVFDETSQARPRGFYPDIDASGAADFPGGTYSFSYPEALLGVAASYRGIKLGPNTIELSAFFSRRRHDLYQYHFQLQERLDSPNEDDNSNVIQLGDTIIRSQTLPRVYGEQIVGANATAELDKKTHLGVTGYFANVYRDFEFQFKTGWPSTRDRIAALGVDFSVDLWRILLSGEYALMDNLSQAAFLQAVLGVPHGEVLASVRAYGTDFDNPHSRGFAESDGYFGDRDRDEVGFYTKGAYRFTRWLQASAHTDLWYRPSFANPTWRLDAGGRLQFNPTKQWRISLTSEWTDKKLRDHKRSNTYLGSGDDESISDSQITYEQDGTEGQEIDDGEGDGSKARLGLEITTTAVPRLALKSGYRRFYADAAYEYSGPTDWEYDWQVGHDFWLTLTYRPTPTGQLTLSARYLDEDFYGSKDERAARSYVQWSQRIKGVKGTVYIDVLGRYTVTKDLIDPPSEDEIALAGDSTATVENPSEAAVQAVMVAAEFRF